MQAILTKLALAAVAASLAGGASAAVVRTFGAGSAMSYANASADFDANLSLSNNYVENGILFSYTGSGGNNGCGYGGVYCIDSDVSELSPSFSGNYMGTAGSNAYISIKMADGSDFQAIEFGVGSGYLNLYGYWKTFNDGVQTGAGAITNPASAILGLRDLARMDEVRFYAFATSSAISGFSAPMIDQVSVQLPEPGSALLLAGGLAGLAMARRRARAGSGVQLLQQV